MQTLLIPILFGVLGGLVRALVGIAKYVEKNKTDPPTAEAGKRIRFGYFAFSLLVAAILGGLAGAFISYDWKIAVLVGYAGTDFFEGLFKLKEKEIAKTAV